MNPLIFSSFSFLSLQVSANITKTQRTQTRLAFKTVNVYTSITCTACLSDLSIHWQLTTISWLRIYQLTQPLSHHPRKLKEGEIFIRKNRNFTTKFTGIHAVIKGDGCQAEIKQKSIEIEGQKNEKCGGTSSVQGPFLRSGCRTLLQRCKH